MQWLQSIRKNRPVAIVLVCLLLLTGLGISYVLYRNTRDSQTQQSAAIAGTVVQVSGNMISLRTSGKDFSDPSDDELKQYLVKDGTIVRRYIGAESGDFVDASQLRTVGAQFVVVSAVEGDAGFQVLEQADLLYLPPIEP